MTETDWLRCRNPSWMLEHLRGPGPDRPAGLIETVVGFFAGRTARPEGPVVAVSERKVRLFGCACCRLVWDHLDGNSRHAVAAVERYADGVLPRGGLAKARRQARQAVARRTPAPAWHAAWKKVWAAARLAGRASAIVEARATGRRAAFTAMRRRQCGLLRDIFGNPFRPMALPVEWTGDVVRLAAAHYAGQECLFALCDALLEAGHPEFAEHFAAADDHPRGCWVVDAILGKN